MIKHTFSNKSVNWLNLHSGLHIFAYDMIYVFFGVYLYQAGLEFWQIFLVLALIYTVRIILRFPAIKLCLQAGVRKIMIIGTLLFPIHYLILGQVQGIGSWLIVFIVVAAMNDVLYWLPYHTYLAVLGDKEHRGKQIGVRESLTRTGTFFGPITGGILINLFGFLPAFIIAALFMVIAALPLLKTPDVHLHNKWPAKKAIKRIQKDGFWFYVMWAFDTQGSYFTWLIVLFIVMQNYVHMGGLLSLAVFFQIVGCFITGHLFDKGHGKRLFTIGLILMASAVIGKVFLTLSVQTIIVLDFILMAGYAFFHPTMNSVFYNLSKESHHPLWFQFMAELGWDIGSIAFCVIAFPILYFSDALRELMLLSLLGMSGMGWFLRAKLRS